MRFLSIAVCAQVVCMLLAATASASTAAFQGTVTQVKPAPANQQEALVQFTCEIDCYDYCSWASFNRDSKVGELITRRTKKIGTAAMIDGRLVNVAAFSKAIKPGQWGYFYEDTWLDLRTTPEFKWGEVVAHDAQNQRFTLRVHSAHKEYHLAANPPREMKLSYAADTVFRQEHKPASAKEILGQDHWVQVHPPRGQIINVWSPDSAFDSGELLPAENGQRGFANDLTAPAVLLTVETKTPDAVIDLSCILTVRWTKGDVAMEKEIACRKTSFILDGKLCPAAVAVHKGRAAMLGHYRREKSPHKIFVRSRDDAIRGVIKSVEDKSIVITSAKGRDMTVALESGGELRLDGVASTPQVALKAGHEITVYPRRGSTIIGFGK